MKIKTKADDSNGMLHVILHIFKSFIRSEPILHMFLFITIYHTLHEIIPYMNEFNL